MKKNRIGSKEVEYLVEYNTYYKEALDWYRDKYFFQHNSKVTFLYFAILCLTLSVACILFFKSHYEIVRSYNGVVKLEQQEHRQHYLNPIENSYYPSNQAIVFETVKSFINSYESYTNSSGSIKELSARLRSVERYSTPEVYKQYEQVHNKSLVPEFINGIHREGKAESCKFVLISNNPHTGMRGRIYDAMFRLEHKALLVFNPNQYHEAMVCMVRVLWRNKSDKIIKEAGYQVLIKYKFDKISFGSATNFQVNFYGSRRVF